jgi:hypothetical protein
MLRNHILIPVSKDLDKPNKNKFKYFKTKKSKKICLKQENHNNFQFFDSFD